MPALLSVYLTPVQRPRKDFDIAVFQELLKRNFNAVVGSPVCRSAKKFGPFVPLRKFQGY